MKKKIVILAAALLVTALTIFSFTGKNPFATSGIGNAIVNEDISFMIYKGYDYTQSLYNAAVASINLAVEKVDSKGGETVIWKQNIDSKTLSQYPSLTDAVKQNVQIHNTAKKDEYFILKYDVIYNTNGHELRIPNAVLITTKSDNTISISI